MPGSITFVTFYCSIFNGQALFAFKMDQIVIPFPPKFDPYKEQEDYIILN